MENIKYNLIVIIKKLNALYSFYSNKELNTIIKGINESSIENIIIMLKKYLDFTLKNHCYERFENNFFNIKEELEKDISLPSKELSYFIGNFFSFLKKHKLDYHLCGGVPLDYSINGKLTRDHKDIDILVNERDIDYFLDELYSLSFDISYQKYYEDIPAYDSDLIVNNNNHEVNAIFHKLNVGFYLFTKNTNGDLNMKKYIAGKEPYIGEKTIPKEVTSYLYEIDKMGINRETFNYMYVNKLNSDGVTSFLDMLRLADKIDYKKVAIIKSITNAEWIRRKKEENNGLSKIS